MTSRTYWLIGLLSVILIGSLAAGTMAAQTDENGVIEIEGVSIEPLARTPPLPKETLPTTAALRRLIFAPGSTLNLAYPGPVLYFVDRGTMGFRYDPLRMNIVEPPVGQESGEFHAIQEAESKLPTGYAIYSSDGVLGPVRNAGDGELVILSVIITSQPVGTAEFREDKTATAEPEG